MTNSTKKVALQVATFAAIFGLMCFFMDMMEETEEQTTYSVTLANLALGNGETNGETGGSGGGGADGETGGTSGDSDAIYEVKNTECTAVTTTTWTTWGTVNGDLGSSSLSHLLVNFGISATAAVQYTHSREVTTKGFKRDCLIGGSNECTSFDCTA